MKQMAKILAVSAAIALAAAFSGCSDSKNGGTSSVQSGNQSSSQSNDKNASGDNQNTGFTPVAGEKYDTGMFTVTVPNGWKAIPVNDLFDKYDDGIDPTTVSVVKGAEEEWDALDHAFVRINLYEKGEFFSGKDWYDDVVDMPAMNVSGFSCSVYSCTSAGYPYVCLEGTNDKNDICFSILTKNDVNSANFDDADVQTILRSVSVN